MPATTTKKNASKNAGSNKVTCSVVFDRDLLTLGQAEAQKESRSFSNWLNIVLRGILIKAEGQS